MSECAAEVAGLLDFLPMCLGIGTQFIADGHEVGCQLTWCVFVDATPLRPQVPESLRQRLPILKPRIASEAPNVPDERVDRLSECRAFPREDVRVPVIAGGRPCSWHESRSQRPHRPPIARRLTRDGRPTIDLVTW